MTDYRAPIADIRFCLETTCNIERLAKTELFSDASADLVDAVLDEAGKLAGEMVAPLNVVGDKQPPVRDGDRVITPKGFSDAYHQIVEGGWLGLGFDPTYGGQGLPFSLALAVQEMWTSANMAFSLCPMLTQGAVEALSAHGSDELKATYLPKLITGEWTGTMNLTEPQAGSDVGALKAKAEPRGDGTWQITGQKIYITWGEHDMAENIIHLVLARTPDAPAGTKGISMFLVPKFFVNDDGSLGARNGVRVLGLEEKLGIHASPTCTMGFGQDEECVGWLIGEENKGMRNMFTMMNHARINVGLQGVAISERATQQAVSYAKDRVQSVNAANPAGGPVPIVQHPDVRRMLMTMRAYTEATRAITYFTASAVDRSYSSAHVEVREHWAALADLLTPVAKAFSTDVGCEITSIGVQVHGGMGYVEETGAAQHMRDARIAPIYEGTNGIQAMDLVGRKLTIDGGSHWKRLFKFVRDEVGALPDSGDLGGIKSYLIDGVDALQNAAFWLQGNGMEGVKDSAAGAAPFLRMFGTILGGHLLAQQALVAVQRMESGERSSPFLRAKVATACFFIEQFVPPATALLGPITRGADLFYALDEDQLTA